MALRYCQLVYANVWSEYTRSSECESFHYLQMNLCYCSGTNGTTYNEIESADDLKNEWNCNVCVDQSTNNCNEEVMFVINRSQAMP